MDMRFCRKIHASWVHQYGGGGGDISSEAIDFIQGRAVTSVFSRHNLTPNQQELKNKVLDTLEKLKQEIG